MNSGLVKRIITAAILIPVVTAGILYLPGKGFAIALGVFVIGGAWEWTHMMGLKKLPARIGFLILTSILLVLLYTMPVLPVVITGVVFWIVAIIQILLYERSFNNRLRNTPAMILAGLLVLLPAWKALVSLHAMNESGGYLVLFLMVIIWVADSGAYFAGHKFGRHKLAPSTSPGKTWEGVAGALVATSIFALVVYYNTGLMEMNSVAFVTLCLVTVMVSVAGDLYESMYKRIIGIKDSGVLIPGHGGVLDRIDSLTAAAPVFVAGYLLLREMA